MEQDFDEWGGPSSLTQSFAADERHDDRNDNQRKPAAAPTLFSIHVPDNVGKRLLRVLGWREGGAYVPEDDRVAFSSSHEKTNIDEKGLVLSRKRLRKIELQQKRVRIPQPKLDTCGLGFEPYEDAPEFRMFKEKRRKLAQERAQGRKNVYRLADAYRHSFPEL